MLITTAQTVKGLERQVEKFFKYVEIVGDSGMKPMQLASWLKVNAYDYGTKHFDECILLDADTLVLPGKSLVSWFDQKQDFVAYYHAVYDFSTGKADKENAMFWVDVEDIYKRLGPRPRKMPQINASWIYFKKSQRAAGIFYNASDFMREFQTEHSEWKVKKFRGFVNEEPCFNMACFACNVTFDQMPHRPIYMQVFSDTIDENYIQHRFKAFSLAGDIQHAEVVVSLYNRLSDYYRNEFGIREQFHFDPNQKATAADRYLDNSELSNMELLPELLKKKIIVVVVVYNRPDNLKKWIKAWKQCEQLGAKLIVIRNVDKIHNPDNTGFEFLSKEKSIQVVYRYNEGYDIGALQDLCYDRLPIKIDWDIVFWATDDTLPMKKDFLFHYANKVLDKKVGISCMHVSGEVRDHIRTTGLCMRWDVAKKLNFPAHIVKTKQHCYDFEHGKEWNLLQQIEAMRLNVVIPSKLQESYVCDIDYAQTKDRISEYYDVFQTNSDKKVTFICPVYNSFPEIVSSLICQTHKNWELLLVHDGPNETKMEELIQSFGDARIIYLETLERLQQWGHPIRKRMLNELTWKQGSDFIVITNADNYHVPTYIETMLRGFDDDTVAVYCDKFVTNYKSPQPQKSGPAIDHTYGVIDVKLELGYIDCAGIMVRKDAACKIGWQSMEHSSDWTYIESILDEYGKNAFVKVNGTLLIHN